MDKHPRLAQRLVPHSAQCCGTQLRLSISIAARAASKVASVQALTLYQHVARAASAAPPCLVAGCRPLRELQPLKSATAWQPRMARPGSLRSQAPLPMVGRRLGTAIWTTGPMPKNHRYFCLRIARARHRVRSRRAADGSPTPQQGCRRPRCRVPHRVPASHEPYGRATAWLPPSPAAASSAGPPQTLMSTASKVLP